MIVCKKGAVQTGNHAKRIDADTTTRAKINQNIESNQVHDDTFKLPTMSDPNHLAK